MILVTGANGVVGLPLCGYLATQDKAFKRVSRSKGDSHFQWDLTQPLSLAQKQSLNGVNTLLHCAPIWLLTEHIETLYSLGVERMVVFSSTSVLSKVSSKDQSEQLLVSQLLAGERALTGFAAKNDLKVTILRPSMIYGYGRDQNVSHISNFIKKYHLMVLVGKAQGLRQPVHSDDLVKACTSVIDEPKSFSKSYNVAGAEVLTYRAMVERIFNGLERKPFIITLPLPFFRFALKFLSIFSSFSYTPEMANRMNQHLAYDFQDAVDDFNYKPHSFLENPRRDLP
jgi:nucleoside-diphosphate-sugar epimerase